MGNNDPMDIKTAIAAAVKQRNPFPAFLAVIIVIVLVLLFFLGLASDVISLIQSSYLTFVIILMGVFALFVVVIIYAVRIWDAGYKPELVDMNSMLTEKQALLTDALQTANAYIGDLENFRGLQNKESGRELLGQATAYLDSVLQQVEIAKHFIDNPNLRDRNRQLRTTHIQIHGDNLAVVLPVGKQHNLIKGLPYKLFRSYDFPELMPTPVGIAIVDIVEEDRSLAIVVVEDHDNNDSKGFWEKAYKKCEIENGGYGFDLIATPDLDPLLKDASGETLFAVQRLLRAIIQNINNAASNLQNLPED
jgi:hypothetical protein